MLPQNFNLDQGFTNLQTLGYVGGSALISELLASPLERAKVKMQTGPPLQSSFPHIQEMSSYLNEIRTKEGLSKIYYGLKGSLDRQVIFSITKFYTYYWAMDNFFKNKKHIFLDTDVLMSCIFSTTLATLASQPSDVLRLKMQGEAIGDEKAKEIGGRAKLTQIMRMANHPNGVLAGLRVNLLAQNLQSVCEVFGFFAVKDTLKKNYILRNDYAINTVSALIASTLGAIVSTPLDLLYTRLAFRDIQAKQTNLATYVTHTIKAEGLSSFAKSFVPYLYKKTIFNLSMVTILQYVTDNASRTEEKFDEMPKTAEEITSSGLYHPTQEVRRLNETEQSQEKTI